jgi:hypothetical protein
VKPSHPAKRSPDTSVKIDSLLGPSCPLLAGIDELGEASEIAFARLHGQKRAFDEFCRELNLVPDEVRAAYGVETSFLCSVVQNVSLENSTDGIMEEAQLRASWSSILQQCRTARSRSRARRTRSSRSQMP